ncbi:MAG TPA: hypothetical protein VK013_14600 [Myxococcaceae bacterium]|nr:hypothetical protein [Myxococcaceae bacterium]
MSRSPHRLLPLLLLLLSPLGLLAPEAHAERPDWFELTSPGFRVLSEAPVEVARETLRTLEALRPGVLGALGAQRDPGAVDVILFTDRDTYRDFAGVGSVAKTSWRTARPLILLRMQRTGAPPRIAVLAHELTHALSHATLGRQPRWIAEGMAELLEDMVPTASGGRLIQIPGPTASPRWTPETAEALLTLDALWAWDRRPPARPELPRYYTASWAWTAYLRDLHPGRWQAFLTALGQGERARAAFDRAFAGISAESLWAGVRAWVGQGVASSTQVVQVTPRAASLVELPLSRSESGVIRAWVRLLGFDGRALGERRKLAAAELDAALALTPGLPAAVHLKSLLGERWDSDVTSLAELR